MVNKYGLVAICFLFLQGLSAQVLNKLSLFEAYNLLEQRYPALRNTDVLNDIHQKELEQLDKSRLPSLYWKGDGQLQSSRIQLDAADGAMLPFEIKRPLYSIQTYVEGQYLIKDGGLLDAQKQLKGVELKAAQQDIEVERFALRQRVNTLAVNINWLREQAGLFDLSLKDVQIRKEQIAAGVENGVLLESELTRLEVKELELKAQQSDLSFRLSGLRNSLAQLLDIELSEDFEINFPVLVEPTVIPELNRPEQQLFHLQREAILARKVIIDADKKVRLSAFAKAGVGYPNPLNILDNKVAPFGIIGLQFSRKITDWKKSAIDKELLSLHAMKLQNAEESFEFNMDTQKANYLSEVHRLQAQIKNDQAIAQLQATILEQLAAQLEEGVITSADYVTQVNAELKARQSLAIHKTELLKIQVEYWNERGGF